MRLAGVVRSIALVEAAKGALVLVAGLGMLSVVHHDAQRVAEALVAHLHLNPASRYPRIFLDAATQVTDSRLLLIAGGALAYSAVRFVEAWGLWQERRWAEWLAAASGAIYIPFELFESCVHLNWMSLGALALNIVVVVIMLYGVRHHPEPEAR